MSNDETILGLARQPTLRATAGASVDSMFLGFSGQTLAKPFDVGSFLDEGDSLKRYDTAITQLNAAPYRTAVEILSGNFDALFLGYAGQSMGKPLDVGRFRDENEQAVLYGSSVVIATGTTDNMWLGFNGQTLAKPLDIGRFRDEEEKLKKYGTKVTQNDTGYYNTAVEIVSDIFDALFLGFEKQTAGKPIGIGRFRNEGESLISCRTSAELVTDVFDQLFFGFTGQTTGKPFGIGRFRDEGEIYRIYNTQRDVADVSDIMIGTRRIVVVPEKKHEEFIDHVEQMRQHYISEFQWEKWNLEEKPVLRALTLAIGEELNELRDAFLALKNKRWLDEAEGEQLDGIGDIVKRSRNIGQAIAIQFFGFAGQPNVGTFDKARFRNTDENWLASYNLSDEEYRVILWQKIVKNRSNGTAEELIWSLKKIFGAPKIVIEEPGNANIVVGIGRRLTDNQILLAKATDLVIKAAGVGLKYKVHFSINNYFGFLGQLQARGFDDGKFADTF